MHELGRVWTLMMAGLLGLIIAAVGVANGARGWPAILAGVGLVLVALIVLMLDPPDRRPYRPSWRPSRDTNGRETPRDKKR